MHDNGVLDVMCEVLLLCSMAECDCVLMYITLASKDLYDWLVIKIHTITGL